MVFLFEFFSSCQIELLIESTASASFSKVKPFFHEPFLFFAIDLSSLLLIRIENLLLVKFSTTKYSL